MKLESRRARRTRDFFVKLGVWIFLVIFVSSVVGVALYTVGSR